MNAGEIVAIATVGVSLAGALVQGALGLARVYMLRERLRAAEEAIAAAEASRRSQGQRIGDVEAKTDRMGGRLDELSRSIHGEAGR